MRIAAVLPSYPPARRVGSYLATHELLAALAARGHDVHVQVTVTPTDPYDLNGVHVSAEPPTAADVVVSHPAADKVCKRPAGAQVRMVHGWHDDHRARLRDADLAVFNSHASAADVAHDGPQIIVRPQLRRGLDAKPGDRVTLINLSAAKGGELFWRLARALPHVEFLGVAGGWGRQTQGRAANVDLLRATPSMANVYGRTRVLLLPSERESWSMVAVEAISNGIPVIAHPTAGVRESLGDAGIFVSRADAHGWVDEIERLRHDNEWETASAAARSRLDVLDLERDLPPFIEAVEALAR